MLMQRYHPQMEFFSLSLRFLDVLAARKDPAGLSGEVLINGALQPPNFKCLSGYVVQVQCMHDMSSVYETGMGYWGSA